LQHTALAGNPGLGFLTRFFPLLLGAVQGDGTAQLLCKDAAAQAEVSRILTEDFGVSCLPFTVPPSRGADAVSQAAPAAAPPAPAGRANGSAVNGSGSSNSLSQQLQSSLEAVNAKTKELALARQRLAEAEAALRQAAPAAEAAAAAAVQPPTS
jgi:hypothetical protein